MRRVLCVVGAMSQVLACKRVRHCPVQVVQAAPASLPFKRAWAAASGRLNSDQSVSLLRVVPPGGRESLGVAVVASQSVDTGLNHNESELGVSVLSELLQVLSDLESLLDQVVEVFRDLGGQARLLQDSEDFAAGDALHLGDSVAISESNTDLGWGEALLGELDNLINEVVRRNSNPAWSRFSVREASACDTLALRVHSAHFVFSSTI